MFSIVRVNNTHSSMLVPTATNFCSQQFSFICFFTDNLPGVWPSRLSYPRFDGHKQRILGRQLATLHKRNCVITNRKVETNMCLGSRCHSTAQDSYCSHNKEKRTCSIRTWTNCCITKCSWWPFGKYTHLYHEKPTIIFYFEIRRQIKQLKPSPLWLYISSSKTVLKLQRFWESLNSPKTNKFLSSETIT